MRAIVRRLLGASSVVVLAAACGAQPNQPVLANAPRPNPGAIAGGAAAAAAALTLADPDAASRKPEKNADTEKKPIKVKENVPASVLDRLDKADTNETRSNDSTAASGDATDTAKGNRTRDSKTDKHAAPAKQPKQPTKPANLKLPRDPLDFSDE